MKVCLFPVEVEEKPRLLLCSSIQRKKWIFGQVCAWKTPHPAAEGGYYPGSLGDGTCQLGSRVVGSTLAVPGAAGSRSIPTPGLRG